MTLDKRQRRLLIGLLGATGVIVILLLVPLLAPDKDKADGATLVIPEADLTETDGSKVTSYRRGGARAEWDALLEEEEDRAKSDAAPREKPEPVTVETMFGDGGKNPPAGRSAPRKGRTGGSSGGGSVSGSVRVDAAPGDTPASQQEEMPSGDDLPQRPQVKRSGAVSSLDEDVRSDLGNGFSTLDGTDRWVGAESGKPYRCMFTRDEKVKSGQRITLRLLEDLVIGGVHIPRNTHLQGVVSVSDRMEIRVSSVDMGGRIVALGFEAYDTDGGKGIYCSDLSQTGKAVTEQGIATVSSTLGSRLGRVAGDAASVGASIVRNKAGEATVSVPAGYTFYLVEKTKQ